MFGMGKKIDHSLIVRRELGEAGRLVKVWALPIDKIVLSDFLAFFIQTALSIVSETPTNNFVMSGGAVARYFSSGI